MLNVCFDFCKSRASSRYLFAAPNSSYRLLHPFFRLSTWPIQRSLPAHGLLGLGLGINQTFYSSDLIVNRKQELTLLAYLVPAKGISTFPMEGIAHPFTHPPMSLLAVALCVVLRYRLPDAIACQLAIYRFVVGLDHHPTWQLPAFSYFVLGIIAFLEASTTQSGHQSGFILQVLASVNLLGELQPALFSLSFPSLKSSQPQLLNYVQLRPYGFFVDATLLPSTGHPSQLRHDVCRARPLPRRSQQSNSWN